jgi:hypothetical protein
MESPHVDPNDVLNEHVCVNCNRETAYERTLEELRQGAKDQCPASRLWLACFEWAVPGLIEPGDTIRMCILDKFVMLLHAYGEEILHLVVFQVQGKSAKQLLRDTD